MKLTDAELRRIAKQRAREPDERDATYSSAELDIARAEREQIHYEELKEARNERSTETAGPGTRLVAG